MSFDPQPELKGTLLELRPLRADDHDALYAAASDPLIWEQHPERDRHEPAVFRRYFAEQLASGGTPLVLDAQSGEAIGLSRYCAATTPGGAKSRSAGRSSRGGTGRDAQPGAEGADSRPCVPVRGQRRLPHRA